MKRTLLAALFGGLITLMAGAFTAQAAPIAAVQAAPSSETLVEKAGWRHRHWHHRRWHRRHHHWGYRRHYRPYVYGYRHHWRPRHHWRHHSYHRRHWRHYH